MAPYRVKTSTTAWCYQRRQTGMRRRMKLRTSFIRDDVNINDNPPVLESTCQHNTWLDISQSNRRDNLISIANASNANLKAGMATTYHRW